MQKIKEKKYKKKNQKKKSKKKNLTLCGWLKIPIGENNNLSADCTLSLSISTP